jgi:hypothetical protein
MIAKAWWNFRANLCEMLFGWSMAIAPDDYVASYHEAIVLAAQRAHPLMVYDPEQNARLTP